MIIHLSSHDGRAIGVIRAALIHQLLRNFKRVANYHGSAKDMNVDQVAYSVVINGQLQPAPHLVLRYLPYCFDHWAKVFHGELGGTLKA